MSETSMPGRNLSRAALTMLMTFGALNAAHAADNPSDHPKGPGMQAATPATGAALTPSPFEPAEHVFSRLDTNRLGYLTREQLGSLERFPFDAADTDRDGRVSSVEFSRVWGPYNTAK